MSEHDLTKGIYLYCFARAESSEESPVGGSARGSGFVCTQHPTGISCKRFLTPTIASLAVGGIEAVFSEVCLEEFQGPSAEDPAWLVPRACAHEKVAEAFMLRSPVLPAQFGVGFSSRDALREFAAAHRLEILNALDYLADKEEWAVKGYIDTRKAIESLMRALQASDGDGISSTGVSYLRTKQLEAQAKRASGLRRRELAEQIRDEFKELSTELRKLKPRQQESPAAQMFLNLAVLTHRGTSDQLCARAREIEARCSEQGLALRVSGPWPPYNFCPALGDATR